MIKEFRVGDSSTSGNKIEAQCLRGKNLSGQTEAGLERATPDLKF